MTIPSAYFRNLCILMAQILLCRYSCFSMNHRETRQLAGLNISSGGRQSTWKWISPAMYDMKNYIIQDCSIKFLQYFKAEKGHEWHKLHLHSITALFIKCDHNRTLNFHHLNISSMFWYLNWLFNCNAKIKSLKLAFNFASSHHILWYGHFLIYFLQIKAIPPSSRIPKCYRNSHLPCLSTVTLLNNSGHIRMCVGGVLWFQLVDY